MWRALVLVISSSVLLLACPRQAPLTVAGSDDQSMDEYSAQLEEIRARGDIGCDDAQSIRKKACGIAQSVCRLASKSPERKEFETQCVTAQETCAGLNEMHARCP